MPSLSQIMKSKTLMFGLLLTLASVVQMLVPYLPPAVEVSAQPPHAALERLGLALSNEDSLT